MCRLAFVGCTAGNVFVEKKQVQLDDLFRGHRRLMNGGGNTPSLCATSRRTPSIKEVRYEATMRQPPSDIHPSFSGLSTRRRLACLALPLFFPVI